MTALASPSIQFATGSALQPAVTGPIIIGFFGTDMSWTSKLAGLIDEQHPAAGAKFASLYRSGPPELGVTHFAEAGQGGDESRLIANVLAMRGVAAGMDGLPPLNYGMAANGLEEIGERARKLGASVHLHCPWKGATAKTWERVRRDVERHLSNRGIEVYIYGQG